MPQNIIFIDKPKGMTSFAVIQQLRKKLGIKKIGHAGTLDPRATGLLVIGIGPGTKELKRYVGLNKTYIADVLLGIQTDTGDLDGEIVRQEMITPPSEEEIKAVLAKLHGKHILPTPAFSATKVGGTPMYTLARSGKRIPEAKREMEIVHSELLDYHPSDNNTYTINIQLAVSSGTYIRSIAEEIGRLLDVPATLAELRRIRVGDFDLKDAQEINCI